MINRSHNNSKRRKLAELLLQELRERGYRGGERIDSVRSLATRFGVTAVTITRMLDDLYNEGKLLHNEKGGFFWPRLPQIGYLGPLPKPEQLKKEFLIEEATEKFFQRIQDFSCKVVCLNYADVLSGHLGKILPDLDGILIDGSHWDEKVEAQLNDFKGKIVLINNLPKETLVPISQVYPDYKGALAEFFSKCEWSSYRKVILVQSVNPNSLQLAGLFNEFMAQYLHREVDETIVLEDGIYTDISAFKYFSARAGEDWGGCLIISLSEYYSRVIYNTLAEHKCAMPDILSFDNLEERSQFGNFEQPYFTSVERRLPEILQRGLDIILRLIDEKSDELVRVGIPAKLIERKSVVFLRDK